jgi:hypothetical protein
VGVTGLRLGSRTRFDTACLRRNALHAKVLANSGRRSADVDVERPGRVLCTAVPAFPVGGAHRGRRYPTHLFAIPPSHLLFYDRARRLKFNHHLGKFIYFL